MSISINKLMNLTMAQPEDRKAKKQMGTKELPDKIKGVSSDLTASQYYNSVKGNKMPKNVGDILQLGTPSGANAMPGNKTVQIPVFSEPDGAIDPNRIRQKTDPNSAQPYEYGGYGLEGGLRFAIPKTARTSSNSVSLLRQAQMSYQNRQQILQPRQPQGQTPSDITQFLPQNLAGGTNLPPSYDESTGNGNMTPYQKSDSELNETYN